MWQRSYEYNATIFPINIVFGLLFHFAISNIIFFFSPGVRFTTYHGHFMLRSTDLLALPAVDCDKAFAMQLALEETLITTQTAYFQVALLYPLHYGCLV